MSDDKGTKSPPSTASPKPQELPPEKQPLENERIHVTVTPKDPKNPDHQKYRDKIKPAIKEDVKKTLDGNKGEGHKKQLDGVDKKADEIKKLVDPSKVKQIDIKVEGDVGKKKVTHTKEVAPDGGKSS